MRGKMERQTQPDNLKNYLKERRKATLSKRDAVGQGMKMVSALKMPGPDTKHLTSTII